jgi:hypothetical protein
MNAVVMSVIIVKIVFIALVIAHHFDKQNETITFYKNKAEFTYISLMAIILIYTFNPRSNIVITAELKYLFFVLGIVLFVTAEWNDIYRPHEPQPAFAL